MHAVGDGSAPAINGLVWVPHNEQAPPLVDGGSWDRWQAGASQCALHIHEIIKAEPQADRGAMLRFTLVKGCDWPGNMANPENSMHMSLSELLIVCVRHGANAST